MEKHTCKLCFRRFSNGRALGGHMRSHVASAAPAIKLKLEESYASPPSSYSSEESEQVAAEVVVVEQVGMEGDEAKGGGGGGLLSYGLRENPKKSFRVVDPEFSSTFAAFEYAGSSSVVVQDRESETESSRNPYVGRRSKRRRRRSSPTTELVSSVSDTTPEEDVALCLMMLSRDNWKSKGGEEEEGGAGEESDVGSDEEDDQITVRSRRAGRSKYQCGTCRKVFRSYQALGGHRASHKKVRGCNSSPAARRDERRILDVDSEVNADKRIHECPVCFRVFGSGQALGGHKRSHLTSAATAVNPNANAAADGRSSLVAATSRFGESWIDLNLPAPAEEDAGSQVEFSAVSDAEQ